MNWFKGLSTMTLSLLVGLHSWAAIGKPTNKLLKIGITQEFENLNPLIMQMLATSYIYKFVNRNLVTMDEKGNWIPQIVKEIPSLKNGKAKLVTENGKQKIISEWEILEKASWGDGNPVTGYDVKLGWSTAKLNTVAVGEKEVYTQIERIEVDPKNPKKFTLAFEKPKWDFYQLGTFYLLPSHLEKSIVEKFATVPEGYSKNSLYTRNPTNAGLYNGPYIISELKLGSHLELVRNPHFYGNPANIEKIIIKLIPNTGTLEANIRSGAIDMISTLGFSFDQALIFEKKTKQNGWDFNTNFRQSLVYEHIDLNLRNEFLQDVRVRKALVFAIDRDKLTKALFEGKQKKAIHNIAPIDPWYTESPNEIVTYSPSKRKAKKLLIEAGFAKGPDGYMYKDGKKLSLPLMTTAGNKTRELVQSFLQKEWKSIGIDVPIKNQPAKVYFGETVKKGKYEAMAMFAWISSPENNPRSTLSSESIPTSSNGFSGQNSGGWKNQNVDKLVKELDLEFNPDNRKKIISKILHEYTDQVPVIPLYYRADTSVTPKNLKNYQITGHQFSTSNFAENWTIE